MLQPSPHACTKLSKISLPTTKKSGSQKKFLLIFSPQFVCAVVSNYFPNFNARRHIFFSSQLGCQMMTGNWRQIPLAYWHHKNVCRALQFTTIVGDNENYGWKGKLSANSCFLFIVTNRNSFCTDNKYLQAIEFPLWRLNLAFLLTSLCLFEN